MSRSFYSASEQMREFAALIGLFAALLNWTCGSSSPAGVEEGRFDSVRLTPSAVAIEAGETVQFKVTLIRMSGLEQRGKRWVWSATGGVIDQDGVYVAGPIPGTYNVQVSRTDNREYVNTAQSVVTIKASSTDPDSPSDPSPPSPSPPTQGVHVAPGTNIQALVDSKPPGTTFILEAGRHMKQSIQPKDGMTFIGEPGAVLDGGGVVENAFDGRKEPSNVTIRGLIIENYAPPIQDGAIMGGKSGQWFTDRWVVEENEIRYNIANISSSRCTSSKGCGGMGVKLGNRMVVRNNYLHHNDEYGVGGRGDGVLVEGNEIAFNNHRNAVTIGFGAGGTKFVHTNGLVVRNNFVHHNHGSGIWMDVENVNTLVEGNRVEDNHDQGIFHEISHAAVVRGNTVRRNGLQNGDWLYGAGVLIAHSDNVEVYGNTVEDNANGIVGIQQDRDNHELKNLWVHDNRISMRTGASGVGKGGSNRYDPFAANNRFDRNNYTASSSLDKPFRWDGTATWSDWRSAGHDKGGSFTIGN